MHLFVRLGCLCGLGVQHCMHYKRQCFVCCLLPSFLTIGEVWVKPVTSKEYGLNIAKQDPTFRATRQLEGIAGK